MFYRKLYLWALIALVIEIIPFMNIMAITVNIIAKIVWGITGYYLYYKHAKKKMLELKTVSPSADISKVLVQIGGVHGWLLKLYFGILIVAVGAAIVIPIFSGIKKSVDKRTAEVDALKAPQQTTVVNIPQNRQQLDKYVGQHPQEIFNEQMIEQKFRTLLSNSYESFRNGLSVAGSLQLKGDFYVGSGCVPHACGSEEAAFAINKQSGDVYAIMLDDSKIKWFGANDANRARLYEWYREHGGQPTDEKSKGDTANIKADCTGYYGVIVRGGENDK